MSVSLKLADDDVRSAARILEAVHDGIREGQAFKWNDFVAEFGESDPRNPDNGNRLDAERQRMLGEKVRRILQQYGTDPGDILRIANAFKTAVLANERGS